MGRLWATFYEPDSPSRALIKDLVDNAYLMNVVHNDFKDPEAIFRPFLAAGEAYAALRKDKANGVVNGVNGSHAVNGVNGVNGAH